MTGFPPYVRNMVRQRANNACERCYVHNGDEQFHHRRPRGMGGSTASDTNMPSNCIYVCAACHRDIESNRDDALHYGWLVRQGHTPSEMPVWIGWRWVLLNDDGTMEER